MEPRIDWPFYRGLNSFYGNPDVDGNGRPDPEWERANLVRIAPPYPMFWAWNGAPVRTISIHKRCADSLERCLSRIGNAFSEQDRKRFCLDECGGAYNFRPMRGGMALSVHSWGAAIDIAPKLNWLGRPYNPSHGMMPLRAVQIFSEEGWSWGGLWKRADAMHFQACRQ